MFEEEESEENHRDDPGASCFSFDNQPLQQVLGHGCIEVEEERHLPGAGDGAEHHLLQLVAGPQDLIIGVIVLGDVADL